jgi:alkanesulfonate monooxygenase SsuD/methylene tetrahydromethanopterin reductase-like flavin-dependent oxidoreductase (luciferase family)
VPLVDPERIVEQMTMLWILTGGRVEFGLGQGTPNAYVTITDGTRKSQVFRDHMARILDLLALGPVVEDGPVISPAPAVEIAERIWVASRDEAAVAFAAEHGLGFVVGQAELASLQGKIVEHYRAHGGGGEVRGIRLVHVAETTAEARARVRDSAALYWEGMKHGPYHPAAVEAGLLPAGEPTDLDGLLERTLFIAGDPELVRDELLEHQRATGVDRVDVMLQLPLLSTETVADTMTLFMEEVAPGLGNPAPVPT